MKDEKNEKHEVVLVDFSESLKVPKLGKLVCSELETVFDEDDFLAYAAAAARN